MGYNKVILNGEQTCDFLLIQRNSIDNSLYEYVDCEPQEWQDDTILFSKFNNDLTAGNSAIAENIVGYELRRQNGANPYTEYVCKIKETNNELSKYIVDYMVSNKNDYSYYLYPTSHSNSSITLSPFVTNEISTDWGYWSLLIVDESDEENLFYLNKMFKFEYNLQTDDMSNNAVVSIVQNFTQYPTVQYGMSNYWSGGLTALCGFISCDDVEFIQTPNMINELKALTCDTRRKFLKDMDGNIMEVKISAPITISTNDQTLERIKSVKISWVEVGKTEGISIINNPKSSPISWILTETGEAVPYKEYTWDEHYKWDNSYRWTANDGILETKSSNIGRSTE